MNAQWLVASHWCREWTEGDLWLSPVEPPRSPHNRVSSSLPLWPFAFSLKANLSVNLASDQKQHNAQAFRTACVEVSLLLSLESRILLSCDHILLPCCCIHLSSYLTLIRMFLQLWMHYDQQLSFCRGVTTVILGMWSSILLLCYLSSTLLPKSGCNLSSVAEALWSAAVIM